MMKTNEDASGCQMNEFLIKKEQPVVEPLVWVTVCDCVPVSRNFLLCGILLQLQDPRWDNSKIEKLKLRPGVYVFTLASSRGHSDWHVETEGIWG